MAGRRRARSTARRDFGFSTVLTFSVLLVQKLQLVTVPAMGFVAGVATFPFFHFFAVLWTWRLVHRVYPTAPPTALPPGRLLLNVPTKIAKPAPPPLQLTGAPPRPALADLPPADLPHTVQVLL